MNQENRAILIKVAACLNANDPALAQDFASILETEDSDDLADIADTLFNELV